MSRVRSKNTGPEMLVRRLVHGLGYRYRIHAKDLPGRPDIVFRSRRKVIFVHGCFWHQHEGCRKSQLPKSPEIREYWRAKLLGNARRDHRNVATLFELGWEVLVVWECETKKPGEVVRRVKDFLQ